MWPRLGKGYSEALVAAGLFALSAPLSKLLLGEVEPIPLAGLLYLGAGLATGISLPFRNPEARLRRGDFPWLLGATLAGGVLAPIALLYGLKGTPAATASLLLSFESVATAFIAAVLFGEFVGRRAWTALLFMTVGGTILGVSREGWGFSPHALLVLLACGLWGLDNNLTRLVSLKDPRAIVAVKGLLAGGFSLGLALALGKSLPGASPAVLGLILGGVSYGMSILLFVRALRELGAARTGALFGLSPFLAAAFSLLIFRAQPEIQFLLALPLIAAGSYLLFSERHEHEHIHGRLAHEHLHRHDDGHHQHPHPAGVSPARAHSHFHVHRPEVHCHPHAPDIHHRHLHPASGASEARAGR
ncbi:EamA family transporter [Candidatus Bipolaricaulota bacterium]|nr:EamA family transporter [Candidatus Bipolaricaulota bacterium]